ncbi:VOC family protein [Streptomyces fuscichromogenes]|uniref:Glyoxalase n=1 Tax=Streptomyces fuscichromogenes TaxID=1324013 RepID=A0A917XMI4_9ACTN|nr:VOC family protein [Streptomyces fuscichromogenes]GGN40595.1 glyoxalase [Streptomyces fuscichromogenes]
MRQATLPAALPGGIRQIGYVVRDLDSAMDSWLSLGVGPWHVIRGMPVHALYRGQPCATTVSVALSNSRDLQIELIRQDDDTPSIYTEFLSSEREGYQQLAWWVDDLDDAVRAVVGATGWPVVWSSDDTKSSLRYAYLEPPNGPAQAIEIMERTAGTDGFAETLRSAAASWDGSQRILSRPPRGAS